MTTHETLAWNEHQESDDPEQVDSTVAGLTEMAESNLETEAQTPEEVFLAFLNIWSSEGKLAISEVIDAFVAVDTDPDDLEDFLNRFQEAGVELDAEVEDDPGQVSLDETPGKASDSGTMDSLQRFLNEIGRTPLLTKVQEIQLSKSKDKGQLAKAILEQRLPGGVFGKDAKERLTLQKILLEHPTYSELPDSELKRIATIGKQDHDHLVLANMRLVVSIAKHYRKNGLAFNELIAEGFFGLNRATEKFDWHRDLKFSTYATWWIRQSVARAVADKSRAIRLPVHVVENLQKINRAENALESTNSRRPKPEEVIAAAMITPGQYQAVKDRAKITLSLDERVGESGESVLGDLLPDKSLPEPWANADANYRSATLQEGIGALSEPEEYVIRARNPLDGSKPKTLDEIAHERGLTRERIRQIEGQALANLARMKALQGLRDNLDPAPGRSIPPRESPPPKTENRRQTKPNPDKNWEAINRAREKYPDFSSRAEEVLTEEEMDVISVRYGSNVSRMSYANTARKLKMTEARVKLVDKAALPKLKAVGLVEYDDAPSAVDKILVDDASIVINGVAHSLEHYQDQEALAD